jgi:hypothetical protein
LVDLWLQYQKDYVYMSYYTTTWGLIKAVVRTCAHSVPAGRTVHADAVDTSRRRIPRMTRERDSRSHFLLRMETIENKEGS